MVATEAERVLMRSMTVNYSKIDIVVNSFSIIKFSSSNIGEVTISVGRDSFSIMLSTSSGPHLGSAMMKPARGHLTTMRGLHLLVFLLVYRRSLRICCTNSQSLFSMMGA